MLATLGDLIEDVVVRLDGPVQLATDTSSRITRRRGGSAANVAVSAATTGAPVRFIGQVGVDAIGTALVAETAAAGVETDHVRRAGTTGTIIVLVDDTGERSMLTDRRTCADLSEPDPVWLDGVTTLHVPLYSLVGGATAATAATVIDWAHDRGVAVSIDLSSSALVREHGPDATRALLDRLRPSVVFANEDEAVALGLDGAIVGAITVVKRGGRPAVVHRPETDRPFESPAIRLDEVGDTTGAGDAFAGGFLTAPDWLVDPDRACARGHRVAHDLLVAPRR